jgi:RNA-dependent RNA polymerase
MKLAELCSKAVDYAKNGDPVDLRNLPRTLIKFKPDWDRTEVASMHDLDYYVSDRALGELFRAIDLYDPHEPLKGFPIAPARAPLDDPISLTLAPLVRFTMTRGPETGLGRTSAWGPLADPERLDIEALYARYAREMQYICATHALVDAPDVRLTEEEVVLGTILANCSQPRLRGDRAYRLKLQSETLVRDVRSHVVVASSAPGTGGGGGPLTERQLRDGLRDAWAMWCWTQRHQHAEFVESFALIALGLILDCLKRLGILTDTETV